MFLFLFSLGCFGVLGVLYEGFTIGELRKIVVKCPYGFGSGRGHVMASYCVSHCSLHRKCEALKKALEKERRRKRSFIAKLLKHLKPGRSRFTLL